MCLSVLKSLFIHKISLYTHTHSHVYILFSVRGQGIIHIKFIKISYKIHIKFVKIKIIHIKFIKIWKAARRYLYNYYRMRSSSKRKLLFKFERYDKMTNLNFSGRNKEKCECASRNIQTYMYWKILKIHDPISMNIFRVYRTHLYANYILHERVWYETFLDF